MENRLMILKEVAEYLHCSPGIIRDWRRTNGFPCIKIGKHFVRYRKAEIDDWLRLRNTASSGKIKKRRFANFFLKILKI